MDEIDYYTDNVNECLTGYVTIDGGNYVSELSIDDDGIEIRLLDFNSKMNRAYSEVMALNSILFQKGTRYYLLFGLELHESSFMRMGVDGRFSTYTFSAQGFLYSKSRVNTNSLFTSVSIHGENIKKWSGSTRKLDKIIECGLGFSNKLPNDDDCVEFEKNIDGLGKIGLYYSYRYGGLSGLHTVGMDVEPHVTVSFEKPVGLDRLIENYIDLYMILRFFIGGSLMISNIKTNSVSNYGRENIQIYIKEKKEDHKTINTGMFLTYSTIYHDDSEKNFPDSVWEGYFNPENHEIKELVKKYVTYSMVHSNEEKFLGFYRMIESMTIRKSCYVDEALLSKLLNRSRCLLAKKFPGAPLGDFIRAIKRTNKSKHNTESCIHHFIKSLPESVVIKLDLKKISINEVCKSRNQIIHQPLFSETPSKIYKHMQATEILTKLALLIRLGVPMQKIEEIICYHR
ncbi:hypothetical protein RVW07_000440 [Citrobacter freundii]|nr:hypothetical protein [Cronobacter sakazakii]EGT5750334.1 hypothetical protein [Cronobacter sakazakii]ELK6069597.1 hypothetical protein [Citrobacter freundii]ELK6556326.1 hypothetical protein [Citrobacter freundii]